MSTFIRLETKSNVADCDRWEIVELVDNNNNLKMSNQIIKSKLIVPPKNLKEGIDDKTLFEMSNQYQIPKLQFPFTIVNGNQVIGIIGLTNLIWSNRRANLNIYLNKDIDESLSLQISSDIIDEYLNYLHDSNLYSISLNVDASDRKMLDLVKNSSLQFYASIPYSISNNSIEALSLCFNIIPTCKVME